MSTKRQEWWRQLGFAPISPRATPPKLFTRAADDGSIMLIKIREIQGARVVFLA